MSSCAGSNADRGTQQELTPLPMPFRGWDPAGVRPRFGTYRGLVRLLLAQVENRTGGYRRFKQIRWESVKRVVFVCHGNICRSPYAERARWNLRFARGVLRAFCGDRHAGGPERAQNCRATRDRTCRSLRSRRQ